jgi:hypothetical protein
MNSLSKLIRKEPTGSDLKNSTQEILRKSKSLTWVPISSWSECSKPCGGGKSYLQRLCVLPEDSKEKCQGERVLTRECNLQPCDAVLSEEDLLKLNYTKKMEIEANFPANKRPERYERCRIKEGDLSIYLDEGSIKGAKIPVRVILNNKTLTIYSNDLYESIIVTHNLNSITNLKLFDKEKSNTCFEIEETKKKTILCTMISSNKSLKDLAKEWQNDILDFIKNCADSYSQDLETNMLELSVDKIQNTLDFFQEKEKDQMDKVIVKTQQLALQAIEKELKVENIIEKEEELKQKKLDEEAAKELEKIKKQKDMIAQALQEKKKQADIYANKLMIKKKIKQISEQVKREVMKIREDLKARILAKQKDEKRKRDLIKNKINTLKNDISKDLLKASKNGNSDECNPDRPTPEILEYCRINYEKDNNKMNECVKNDNFCYMCCESEFGDLHLESRSVCYTKCDDFYIYKIKFGNAKGVKINVESTPKGVKTKKETETKSENKDNNQKQIFSTKFLETDSTKVKEKDSDSDSMNAIEEEMKRELLLDIKEDLNI